MIRSNTNFLTQKFNTSEIFICYTCWLFVQIQIRNYFYLAQIQSTKGSNVYIDDENIDCTCDNNFGIGFFGSAIVSFFCNLES